MLSTLHLYSWSTRLWEMVLWLRRCCQGILIYRLFEIKCFRLFWRFDILWQSFWFTTKDFFLFRYKKIWFNNKEKFYNQSLFWCLGCWRYGVFLCNVFFTGLEFVSMLRKIIPRNGSHLKVMLGRYCRLTCPTYCYMAMFFSHMSTAVACGPMICLALCFI